MGASRSGGCARYLAPMFRRTASACFVALVGCGFDSEHDFATTRLVFAETGCPAANVVRNEGDREIEELELVRSRQLEPSMICWYRVEAGMSRGLVACDEHSPSIEEVREHVRSRPPPYRLARRDYLDESTHRCTNEGEVIAVLTEEETCEVLDGRLLSERLSGASERDRFRQLVAVDMRPPLLLCEFEGVDEQTHRSGCNGTSSYGGI